MQRARRLLLPRRRPDTALCVRPAHQGLPTESETTYRRSRRKIWPIPVSARERWWPAAARGSILNHVPFEDLTLAAPRSGIDGAVCAKTAGRGLCHVDRVVRVVVGVEALAPEAEHPFDSAEPAVDGVGVTLVFTALEQIRVRDASHGHFANWLRLM